MERMKKMGSKYESRSNYLPNKIRVPHLIIRRGEGGM